MRAPRFAAAGPVVLLKRDKDTDAGGGGGLEIRELRRAGEAEAAAAIMAATDPWVRLGRSYADTLRAATDPAANSFVAVTPVGDGNDVVGVVIVQELLVFSGYVRAVAVRPDWRNRGVGRALLAHAEERIFRTWPNVFLCVSSFNADARRLYQQLGYETIGEIREFIIPGAGEFLMRKTRGPVRTYRGQG
jgi:ribosomal protein S18 acetylase RimI-like enzyme